jgi:hypothetical protein
VPWAGCTICVKGAKCVEQNGMLDFVYAHWNETDKMQNGTSSALPTMALFEECIFTRCISGFYSIKHVAVSSNHALASSPASLPPCMLFWSLI